jgi:alcohol dehydrogenase, propanol-preferring
MYGAEEISRVIAKQLQNIFIGDSAPRKTTQGGQMRAVRFQGVGRPAQVVDVLKPKIGPGEVVIKIGGAGVCHSDLHLMEEDFGLPTQFTLGHENAGWVSEVGQGVKGIKEGDAVAVYGPWGCGYCHACQTSMENYCENYAMLSGMGGGLGFDGGMADFMLVPSARLLVPLGNLSPEQAAPLSDAALTPYHAIKRALPSLHADTTVVVLGIGGLGHMAVQLLNALTPARMIAGDIDEPRLEQAKRLGADHTVNTGNVDQAAEEIGKITGPRGAAFVLDCVGIQSTIRLGAKVLGRNASWTIVGLGGGHHDFHHGSTPYGTVVSIPYWGSRTELMEVIAMARNGRIHAEITTFPLDQAVDVYNRLKAGKIKGRAVLVPTAA